MRVLTTFNLIAAVSLLGTGVAAQQPSYKREVPDSLARLARITEDSARTIALRRVQGRVTALELEREHGRLLYSWDIKVAGKAGITEVHVDALNGRVLAVEHENPKPKPATPR